MNTNIISEVIKFLEREERYIDRCAAQRKFMVMEETNAKRELFLCVYQLGKRAAEKTELSEMSLESVNFVRVC